MTNKGNPFHFDSNFFDPEDPRYTPIDRTKPKAEYTLSQINEAKEAAFEAGRIAGFKEAQSSLNQDIQRALQKLDRETTMLFVAEEERNTRFEAEAVHLTIKIFEKIFQAYAGRHGTSELKAIISHALREHKEQNLLAVEVHPSLQAGLQDYVNQLPEESHARISVKGSGSLSKQECKILWANGGITYDMNKIKAKIFAMITESLAVYDVQVHNDESSDVETGSGESKA